jgi:hypothetical protein
MGWRAGFPRLHPLGPYKLARRSSYVWYNRRQTCKTPLLSRHGNLSCTCNCTRLPPQALHEAGKYLSKSKSDDMGEKSAHLNQRVALIERFVTARGLITTDADGAISICNEVLMSAPTDADASESGVRVGDVFALMIEYWYERQKQKQAQQRCCSRCAACTHAHTEQPDSHPPNSHPTQLPPIRHDPPPHLHHRYEAKNAGEAYKLVDAMRGRGIAVGPYLDQRMVEEIHKALGLDPPTDHQQAANNAYATSQVRLAYWLVGWMTGLVFVVR